ncbi:MAG: aminodeoxychorismate synthase component I [Angustibacter sp.]
MTIILVDNFDSFTLNIAQYLYEVSGIHPLVVPNTTDYDDLPQHEATAVVLSPGPGRPSRAGDFGVCRELIARCGLPMLGVCLGHQGIGELFGARTVHAPAPMHGIVDTIEHSGTGLFRGLAQNIPVVRYHSLISTQLPAELECTAWTGDGLVMAMAHRSRPIWGVQFHPESIATHGGHQILSNFLALGDEHRRSCGVVVSNPTAPDDDRTAAVRAFHGVGGASRYRLLTHREKEAGSPMALFRSRYAGREHAFWLDSEGSDRPGSRYSLMGAAGGEGDVVLTYDLSSRTLALTGEAQASHVSGDLFSLLEEIGDAVDVQVPDDWPLPFRGGFVGWFGYELKALTIGEEHHRSPDPASWFVLARRFTVIDHATGLVLDCQLVVDEPSPGPLLEHVPPVPAQPVGTELGAARFLPGPVREERLGLRTSRERYLGMIQRAQDLIVDGETYEVCLTNRAAVPAPADGLAAYGRMRQISPVPYGAYLRCGDLEVLSCSPETFLRIGEDRMVESRPIKGTRPRGCDPQEDDALRTDLLQSPKDRAENLMIVDLIRHDLNTVCEPGSVHVPEAFAIESYSSVHQLVSTIRGRLRWGCSALSAVRAAFPGGSMTGAPKRRTMQIIDELEGSARGIYSGALGWLSFSGALDLSIVIRTAVIRDGVATFGIGGAITAKSDPEEEFVETLVKASVPYHGLHGWSDASWDGHGAC